MGKTLQTRQIVELLSIISIMAVFLYLELKFQYISLAVSTTIAANPELKNYSFPAFGAIFIGLAVYSIMLRTNLKSETRARKDVEDDLSQYKVADPVTGLPNRLGLELVATERFTDFQERNIALLAIGISNLDTVRSVHGSKTSERIELAMANYLVSLSEGQDFIANGSRSVFYLLVEAPDEDYNRFRIDQIIEAVIALAHKGVPVGHVDLQLHVNFGTVCVNKLCAEYQTADAALQRVDFALGNARGKGRGESVIFDPTMETSISQQAMVEGEIIQALATNQIVPYFQPLIDLQANAISGFEILTRWEHPEHGLIMPDVFIPIAESTGALHPLTLHVLRIACVSAREWPEHHKLAINVSPTDLRNDILMEEFLRILTETGIGNHRIEIEITESAFIEEASDIANTIANFKSKGISISIDDFGTGYSSLHHLRVLPFDKIKIDQSFIRNMHTDTESHEIVKTIIALGKSLGLPTTAEGIEIGENRDLLLEMGCSIGQGYLYAKPLPGNQIMDFIDKFERSIKQLSQVA